MVEQTSGIGERREASARRKRLAIFGVLGLTGLLTGMFIGHGEAKTLFEGGDPWSPQLAIALAVIYLIAVGGGTLLLRGTTDEVQQQAHYKAGALAGAVYLLVYPLWFLLWKGGLTGEPIDWVLYVLFVIISLTALLFYRFR